MRTLGWLAAAALVTTPLLLEAKPADAATANQYRAQGRGVYLNSKGHPRGGFRPRWAGYGYGGPPYGAPYYGGPYSGGPYYGGPYYGQPFYGAPY